MHAASWLNLEVQPASPSELGLAHLLGRFFYQHMSGFDHQLINLIDNLRCEKRQVILDRLSFVRRFVLPASMPEHLPDRVVMVGNSWMRSLSVLRPRRSTLNTRIFHCSIPGRPRRWSALRCLSSLLRPGPLREGMTRSRTLNTEARNAALVYMCCKPRRIGGMSSRDLRSNSMAAMSTSPNFIWGSRTVHIKFQILKIHGKTKGTNPKIL